MRIPDTAESRHLLLSEGELLQTPCGSLVIGSLLGEGRNAKVWAARRGDQELALKIYIADVFYATAAIEGEGRVLSEIHGSGNGHFIVRYSGYFLIPRGNDVPHVALVFERLGASVLDISTQGLNYANAPRASRVALSLLLLKHILTALRSIHSLNRVHGDIKPENILTTTGGNIGFKLVDFNHCTVVGSLRLPSNGVWRIGTLWYRAPEVVMGRTDAIQQSMDVWSLGCVIAEIMCCGNPLFQCNAGNDDAAVANVMLNEILNSCNADTSSEFSESTPETPSSVASSDSVWSGSDVQQQSPNCRYNYLFQPTTDLRDSLLQDLLHSMLAVDPQRRITSCDALKHPVFSTNPVKMVSQSWQAPVLDVELFS